MAFKSGQKSSCTAIYITIAILTCAFLSPTLLANSRPVSAQYSAPAAKSKKRKAVSKKATSAQPPKILNAEIKLLIHDDSIETFLKWVNTYNSEFEQRHVFFFDTKELSLLNKGLSLRLRRLPNETYDTTAKLRQESISELPSFSWRSAKNLSCEKDIVVGASAKDACSVIAKSKKILKSVDAERPEIIFSNDQLKLVRSTLADFKTTQLKSYGRIISSKWTFNKDSLEISCELWTLPNLKKILDCSTTTSVEEAPKAEETLLKIVKGIGIKASEKSDLKTDLALKSLGE